MKVGDGSFLTFKNSFVNIYMEQKTPGIPTKVSGSVVSIVLYLKERHNNLQEVLKIQKQLGTEIFGSATLNM